MEDTSPALKCPGEPSCSPIADSVRSHVSCCKPPVAIAGRSSNTCSSAQCAVDMALQHHQPPRSALVLRCSHPHAAGGTCMYTTAVEELACAEQLSSCSSSTASPGETPTGGARPATQHWQGEQDDGTSTSPSRDNLLVDAAAAGQADVVALLLQHGADVHARQDDAICMAAYGGHLEMVCLLLQAGAPARAQGDAPLRFAACQGHTEVVRLLLQQGACPCAHDAEALRAAAFNGHAAVVELLLRQGGPAPAPEHRKTALQYAVRQGHAKVARLLALAGRPFAQEEDASCVFKRRSKPQACALRLAERALGTLRGA